MANGGAFRMFHKVFAIGRARLLDLIKIQRFKSASQLCMLDSVHKYGLIADSQ